MEIRRSCAATALMIIHGALMEFDITDSEGTP
jgi:hypothetical protein